MSFQKCFFCNKIRRTPYHVTEIEDKVVEAFDMCSLCAIEYLKGLNTEFAPKAKPNTVPDISNIQSTEDLLDFINQFSPKEITTQTAKDKDPCKCGMTTKEIEKNGRFGCPHCYDHFEEFMKQMVYPFHKADEHLGKTPKTQIMQEIEADPEEKMKLLKLKYAKAIELEEYEQAAEINKEIKQLLDQFPLSSSEDL
jgi:protein arginine kinase activator